MVNPDIRSIRQSVRQPIHLSIHPPTHPHTCPYVYQVDTVANFTHEIKTAVTTTRVTILGLASWVSILLVPLPTSAHQPSIHLFTHPRTSLSTQATTHTSTHSSVHSSNHLTLYRRVISYRDSEASATAGQLHQHRAKTLLQIRRHNIDTYN